MKTKEIDAWVIKNKKRPFHADHLLCCFSEEEKSNWLESSDEIYRAKLIIELPEKKIEITESQFDEALEKSGLSTFTKPYKRLKHNLGFTNESN